MKTNTLTFQPVPGFETLYQIDRSGVIKSVHKKNRGHIMSQRIDRAGYLTIKLSKHGKDSTQYVHRLLALAFIPNPMNKQYVNHINGNKLDNRLENLEWVDHSENMKHAFRTGLCSFSKKPVIDRCSGRRYLSIKEAARALEIPYETCKNFLSGRRPNPTCLAYSR